MLNQNVCLSDMGKKANPSTGLLVFYHSLLPLRKVPDTSISMPVLNRYSVTSTKCVYDRLIDANRWCHPCRSHFLLGMTSPIFSNPHKIDK